MADEAGPGAQPFATDAGAADAHLPPAPPPGDWRQLDRLVVLVFAIALVVPGALLAIGVHVTDIENRAPRPLPVLSVAGLLDASWPAGVDAFLTDHLAPRPYAIRVRGEAYWLAGGTGSSALVRGLEGWLFIREEFQPNCQFTGAQQRVALEAASDAFAATRQQFRMLLVPDKHAVYADKVAPAPRFPTSCEGAGRPEVEAATAALDGQLIDLQSAMAAAREVKGSPDLYWSMDTHWTPSGAVVGVRELIRSLEPDLWSDADVVEQGALRRVMDAPRLIGLRRVARTPKLVIRPGVEQHQTDVDVPVSVQNVRTIFRITSSGDRPLLPGRTVVIYDSFFGIETRLVAPFFADSTWIHVSDLILHPELATILGPFDRVILERVQRGLYETDLGAALKAVTASPGG